MIDENIFADMIKANIELHKAEPKEEYLYTCESCGELVEELVDTMGMLNGGIGSVCHQCIEDYDIGN